jgi:hypothetical protein
MRNQASAQAGPLELLLLAYHTLLWVSCPSDASIQCRRACYVVVTSKLGATTRIQPHDHNGREVLVDACVKWAW